MIQEDFADVAAEGTKIIIDEAQWTIIAGGIKHLSKLKRIKKMKRGPKFPNLKDHAVRISSLHPGSYYNQAIEHMKTGKSFLVRHDGKTKRIFLT